MEGFPPILGGSHLPAGCSCGRNSFDFGGLGDSEVAIGGLGGWVAVIRFMKELYLVSHVTKDVCTVETQRLFSMSDDGCGNT